MLVMGVIAAAVRELVAAGVAGDELVRAIERIEDRPPKRSPGAIRQQRYRERKASHVTSQASRDVTSVTQERFPPAPASSSPSPPLHNPPSPPPTSPPKPPSREARASRLSADWWPTKEGWDFAVDLLLSGGARLELDKFRDYWKAAPGKNGTKVDWHATWRNWCRRAAETKSRGPPRGRGDGYAAVLEELRGNGQSGNTDDGQDADQARTIEHDADLFRPPRVAPGRR